MPAIISPPRYFKRLFPKTVYLNDFPGVDPTGVVASDAAWLLARAVSGATTIVFEGIYRFVQNIEPLAGQILDLRGGTDIRLYGTAANSTKGFVEFLTGCWIDSQPVTKISRPASEAKAFIGVRALSIFDCGIEGKVQVTGFGNAGVKVTGAGTGNNQFRNARISGDFSKQVDQLSVPNGTGIYLNNAAEYVSIDDVICNENTGFGIFNDKSANSPIKNSTIMRNTLGGIKIVGGAGNTDHLHITGCTINHNDAVGTFGLWFVDVDTGVVVTGCSILGNAAFKVENSLGVTFNGCEIAAAPFPHIAAGSTVNINGGHLVGGTRAALLAGFTGGGTLNLNNVAEST